MIPAIKFTLAVAAALTVEEAALQQVDDIKPVTVEVPKVEVPQVYVPKVYVPEIVKTKIVMPELAAACRIPSASSSDSSSSAVSSVSVRSKSVKVPLIVSGGARIPEFQALLREAMSMIDDRRNLMTDPDFGPDSAAWRKWLAIYRKNEPYTLEYKPLPADLRIIAEVKCPVDSSQSAVLEKNLGFYHGKGYNSVLLTFDTSEDLGKLIAAAELIRKNGMKIVCAYSGPENLKWSVYRDPDKIAEYVSRICELSDAFLIGWRRTSCHLLIQDAPFRNHLLRAARRLNPNIAVIGEAYYGQTGKSDHRATVTYNVPANSSAVLLFGIGYKGVAIELAMDGMFPDVKTLPRIGLAIGEKPYFDTRNDTGKTFADNLKIKQRIERRFRSGGCVGTMTIRGDGSDGTCDERFTENLSQPYGKEEQ